MVPRAGLDGYGKSRPHRDLIPGVLVQTSARVHNILSNILRGLFQPFQAYVEPVLPSGQHLFLAHYTAHYSLSAFISLYIRMFPFNDGVNE